MKICVFGVGAVGGQVAGRLAAAGADVSVVGLGETIEVICREGLRVETGAGILHSTPVATERSEELGPQDVVFVTVKAQSLPHAIAGVAPLLGPETPVVFMANGIPWWYFQSHGGPLDDQRLTSLDPGDVVRSTIEPRRVVGAVAYTASTVIRPGVVYAGNPRNRIILGRPDGQREPLFTELEGLLRGGGFEVAWTDRIRDAVWTKLVMNLVGGSLAVLTGYPMGMALAEPAVERAARQAANEAASVAAALGCDGGDIDAGIERLKVSTHKQSILQDFELGLAMEVDAMIAAPLRLARLAGVPTPTLDLIAELAVLRATSAGLYAKQGR